MDDDRPFLLYNPVPNLVGLNLATLRLQPEI